MKFSPNLLKPIVKEYDRALPDYAVFDIEANDWKEFVVAGFYDGKKYRDYGSMLELLLDITNHTDDGREPADMQVFAHNGGAYDFNFVLQCVIMGEGKKHFRLENILPRGNTFLSMEVRRMYKDSATGEHVEGPLITFRDSLALLPFSLKSLTENFKTECAKGEWDHKNVRKTRNDPKLLEYLKADCVGLFQVLDKYFKWPMIREAGFGYTVAGQALKVFRTYMEEPLDGCPKYVDEFVRKAYFGGRTEIFKPYYNGDGKFEIQKLSCWDINSLYPSVMRDFEYPTKFDRFTYKYDPKSFGFWEAEVDVPEGMYVPPLGTLIHIDKKTKAVEIVADSSEGKFIFPTGRFSGVWTTIELEYAKSLGVKVIKTGKGAIFKNGGHIFKNFVQDLWDKRKKADKDSVDSFICKLLLNSSYGRFGLNLMREQLVIDNGQCGVSESAYEFDTGDEVDGRKVFFRFVKEKKEIQSFTNVAIAAWVTAHARIRMHKQYVKAQKYLYYTDTDSVFTMDHFKLDSSKELGEFKYEYSAGEACFLLPKTYALARITGLLDKKGDFIKAKAVIKGINREAMKMRNVGIEDLHKLLEGDFKRAHIGPIDPLAFDIEPKFAKVKTAMRKGTFLYVQPGTTKMLKSRYDKRVIYLKDDGTYDTKPIHITDGYAYNYNGGQLNIKLDALKKNKKVTITLEEEANEDKSDNGSDNKRRRRTPGRRTPRVPKVPTKTPRTPTLNR